MFLHSRVLVSRHIFLVMIWLSHASILEEQTQLSIESLGLTFRMKYCSRALKSHSKLRDACHNWVKSSVMRVGSDTFGDPIFQKGLQN